MTPWSARLRRLAVALGVLASSAALGAAFPAVLRIPRRDPAAAPFPPRALFSHRQHQSFGCFACHPSLFPQALAGFTHEQMADGKFCGHCHDGRTAFAIPGTACARCHVDGR